MESCNKTGVRQYKKSASPRLQWTPELHEHFVEAVEQLGGKFKATPNRIIQMMGVRGLQVSHVKSHLQMYRSIKRRTTIKLVVPTKLHEKETPYGVVRSPPSKVGKDQETPKMRKESGNSITCKSKLKTINHGDHVFNCQVTQGTTSCSALEDSDSGIFDFLQAIVECGKEPSLWSSNDRPVSQSSASSNSFEQLHHQSCKDNQVNLDLSISSCYNY